MRARLSIRAGRSGLTLLGSGCGWSVLLLLVGACAFWRSEPVVSPLPAPQGAAGYAIERRVIPFLDSSTTMILHLPVGLVPPLPGVLLFPSSYGRTPATLEFGDSLARRGYAVITLDLFGGKTAKTKEESIALRDWTNQYPQLIDGWIGGAYQQLLEHPRIQAKRRFLVGWSYGGAFATYAAGALKDVTGLAVIHGEAFSTREGISKRVRCEVLLIGGRLDADPSPERLAAIQKSLGSARTEVLLLSADHGFMEPRDPNFAGRPSELARAAIYRFLDRRRAEPLPDRLPVSVPEPPARPKPDWFAAQRKVNMRAWMKERRLLHFVDQTGRIATTRETDCVPIPVGDAEGLVCGALSRWTVWQAHNVSLRLVFSVRRQGFWLTSRLSASADGTEIVIGDPGCLSAFEQAREKGELVGRESRAAMAEVCRGVGRWVWTGKGYRRSCQGRDCWDTETSDSLAPVVPAVP